MKVIGKVIRDMETVIILLFLGVLHKSNGDYFEGEWINDLQGRGISISKLKEFIIMQMGIDMKVTGRMI